MRRGDGTYEDDCCSKLQAPAKELRPDVKLGTEMLGYGRSKVRVEEATLAESDLVKLLTSDLVFTGLSRSTGIRTV
jgi:hypothetical protein